MVYFGGLLALIGVGSLVFRDGDVIGLPASVVGIALIVIGAGVSAFGVVRRRKVRARKIAQGEPVPVGDVIERARALPRLIRAARSGAYGELPKRRMTLWVLAVIYLVSPFDILPDLLPIIGVTDDAGVLVWLLTSVSTAAGLYINHERKQVGQRD
ncbi:YkvA family protein [Kribbella sp. NBC_01505]|uniref:YkvA family protein n=1 Tax=Kribbella sp. NBC_01505 TaxID=2903580 RepID=UPI003869A571